MQSEQALAVLLPLSMQCVQSSVTVALIGPPYTQDQPLCLVCSFFVLSVVACGLWMFADKTGKLYNA